MGTRRTVTEVLNLGCIQCSVELDPDFAVVVIAKYALVPDEREEPQWTKGNVAFVCHECADTIDQPAPTEASGTFSTL